MGNLGSSERPLRVAIIGSGPSGYYAADSLLKSEIAVKVHVFDRLPTPYGLVRHGVAPDHQRIKTSINVLQKTALHEDCAFYGNVRIGSDLKLAELQRCYDALIFATGAETDRQLNIPGEDLPGSHTATEFVAWYNGHPDFRDREFDLSHPVAVVIGQGNVAADVSRILAKTVDELKETDIAAHALEALAKSKVTDIYMIGRRGPVQAKFTNLEIKELGRLADCDPVVDEAALELSAVSREELDTTESKSTPRVYAQLQEFASRDAGTKGKRLHFRFLQSPVSIGGSERVERVTLETNLLTGAAFSQRAEGTGEQTELSCGLVLRSVGYRGIPMDDVPFDEARGVIPNEGGRVLNSEGNPVPGLYTVGWIKRGPTGVIGTNKRDSVETVEALLNDVQRLKGCPSPDDSVVDGLLAQRGIRRISFAEWKSLDTEEVRRGEEVGKPREKFTRVDDMLSFLDET